MQQLGLKVKGLHTHPNELGSVPEGALVVADDINIDKEDIAEPRRGFNRSHGGFSNTSFRANKLFFYKNYLIAHYSTNLLAYYSVELADSSANFTGSGSWTAITGTYAPPSGCKVRVAEANQNLYFTTSAGVYKLDAIGNTPVKAGAYKGLDLSASSNGTTSGWLSPKYRTAYRLVWGYKDANGTLVLGAPSQRESFKNVSLTDTISVNVRATIPVGVTTAWFYQLYRAASVDNTSTDVEPSDEMGLVYEGNPASSDLTNGYIDITDIVPDELRGATLYTSSSQQGLAKGNEQPPLAKDIAVYKGVTFYANTVSKHRYFLTLLSVGGTSGIAVNDTLTIGGVVYTAKSAESIPDREFKIATGGSASQKITDTALSLVRVINRSSTSTVYAYYLSGPDDLPGKILLEERGLGGAAFALVSSKSTCWSPSLPSSGTSEQSTNDQFKNGISFSKDSEPEAVPLAHVFRVGSADKAILRVVPLRDSLFVLKEDGVFRISGEDTSSLRVDLFDSTTRLIAPESAVVLNNQIYCLSDQGVVSITESGVQVRSRPIENILLEIQGENPDVLANGSFGVAYESERKYILFVPEEAADTAPTQAYVFNTFTNTWTRWVLSKTCGVVNPSNKDDRLYLGDAGSRFVNQERKTFGFTDYVDYGFQRTISQVSGTEIVLDSVQDIDVGDVLYKSSSIYSIVEDVNTSTSTVTVAFSAAFTTGSVDVLKAIPTRIAWAPFSAGNPGILKHFREVTLLFKKDFVGSGSVLFHSEASPTKETEDISGTPLGQWGLGGWGGFPWGGVRNRRPSRVLVPRNKRRCSQLSIEFCLSTGYANYQLAGLSIVANTGSERVTA